MRLTLIAIALLPVSAFAQSTTAPATPMPLEQSQSCAAGTVFDQTTQLCVAAEDRQQPLLDAGTGHNCDSTRARDVTS